MLENRYRECIEEFEKLLDSEQYISYRIYNRFLEKYNDVFENQIYFFDDKIKYISNDGYKCVDNHNEKITKIKLKKHKRYFDRMFKNIDNSIKLDIEQRKAIVNEEDYTLIIAGAGAGKTTTMAAKVKYLIEKCNIEPEKIAVISYTNKATEELEDRIKYEFKLPVDIMTFHSLGMKIIKKVINQSLQPVSSKQQEAIIVDYVKDILFNDKELLSSYIKIFNKYNSVGGTKMFSKGFVNNYQKFTTFDEYFDDYKKRKFEENKDNLKSIIDYKIDSYLRMEKIRTIKNEIVESKAEAKIANFLYLNNVDYSYEEPFPEKIESDRVYRPDFTVYHNDIPIYIEYYGLSGYYENGKISKRNRLKYEDIRNKKRKFHEENKNYYIELDNKNGKKNYLEELKKQLEKYGIVFTKRNNKEIYNQLLDNNVQSEFFKFINFILDIINEIKTNVNRDYFKENVEKYIEKLDNLHKEKFEMLEEIELINKIYKYYQNNLIPKNKIDFADMIYNANKYMNNISSEITELDYEYIIIDEYQDISIDRYQFAQNVSLLSNAKVVSVGDDWQTIFSFAGSRIDLFYKYNELFLGAKKLFINSTYRNSQQLIDLAGDFVMKNPLQIRKNLISLKQREKPIKICYYDRNQYSEVNKIIDKIYRNNPNDKVMILARKNKHIDSLIDSEYFESGIGSRIVNKKHPSIIIDAMSVHSAKGLGADQVIILNVTDSDFPCKDVAQLWIKSALKEKCYIEDFPDAEERRVFYVALTRTKKDVYLMTPKVRERQSSFIEEIIEQVKI